MQQNMIFQGVPFLSTPVLMHGGLICIAFCLSDVTGPKLKLLENNSHLKKHSCCIEPRSGLLVCGSSLTIIGKLQAY